MSDLGDLTLLFQDESKSLSDLDWLDVDEEEYRKLEILPKSPHGQSIPELELQWGRERDDGGLTLSPENLEPAFKTSPFDSELPNYNDLSNESKAEIVERFFRKHMMSGMPVEECLERLQGHFDKRVIAYAIPRIKSAVKSRGLVLAREAIEVFGEVPENLQGIDVKDVSYEESVWKHYEAQALEMGKDLSGIKETLPLAEKIRQAAFAPMKGEASRLDGRTKQKDITKGLSSKQAAEKLDSTEIKREIVEDIQREAKVRRVAVAMMNGNYGPHILASLDSDPDLAGLKPHKYVLGSLYADLTYFEDKTAAQEYVRANPNLFHFDTKNASEGFFKNAQVISKIVRRYALHSFGEQAEKHAETLKKLANTLVSMESEEISKFARETYSYPLPTKIRKYANLAVLDYEPTKGISTQYAVETLQNTEVKREVVANTTKRDKVRKVAIAMMNGNHGPHVQSSLESDPDLSSLKPHLHLLGSLYADFSYFEDKDSAREYLEANPEMFHLNTQNKTASSSFFQDPKVISKIIHRYALASFGENAANHTTTLRKLSNRLVNMKSSSISKFAQEIYTQPLPSKVRKYANISHVEYDPTKGMKVSTAQTLLQAFEKEILKIQKSESKVERQAREMGTTIGAVTAINDVAKRMLAGDHSEAIREMIAADQNLHGLKEHVHLLGKLYTANFMFDDRKESDHLLQERTNLSNLPVYNPALKEDFYGSINTLSRILVRSAQVQGMSGRKAEEYIKANLPVLKKQKTASIIKFAQAAYSQEVQGEVKAYSEVPYTTKQDKIARAKVTVQDMSTFTKNLKKKRREVVARDLSFYLKKAGGDKLLEMLNQRLGMESVRALWLTQNKTSSSLQDAARREDLKKVVLAEVLNENFKPVGYNAILPEMFETKIGKWIRDRMVQGSMGVQLIGELQQNFSEKEILDNAPMILALREEEGLFGQVYSFAEAFEDCRVGNRAVKANVDQIVKSSKCNGCVFNKIGSCLLYGKDLVEEPVYTEEHVKAVLANRLKASTVTKLEAQAILGEGLSPKEKLRVANTFKSLSKVAVSDSTYKAHYGETIETAKTEKQLGVMLVEARDLIVQGQTKDNVHTAMLTKYGSQVMKLGEVYFDQVFDRTTEYLKLASELSKQPEVASGLDMLEEFEFNLTGRGVLDDLEYNPENTEKSFEGVTFEDIIME